MEILLRFQPWRLQGDNPLPLFSNHLIWCKTNGVMIVFNMLFIPMLGNFSKSSENVFVFKLVFTGNPVNYQIFSHTNWESSFSILINLKIEHHGLIFFVKKTWYLGRVLGLNPNLVLKLAIHRSKNYDLKCYKNTFSSSINHLWNVKPKEQQQKKKKKRFFELQNAFKMFFFILTFFYFISA